MEIILQTYDRLDSTNTLALDQARRGANEGLCIVARQQTAGRGRHGRAWVSEKDAGLYFSIILRPRMDTQHLPLITLMAGVAVYHTLSEYGVDADIKWVNDLLFDEKKISGILAETAETPTGVAVIVGVGINIRSSNLKGELARTATSIETAAGRSPQPEDLAETLTRFISYFYEILCEPDGPKQILEEWSKRSSYYSGRSVRVRSGRAEIVGVTDGLESNGALRVKTADGDVKIIQTGDVERLRADGPLSDAMQVH